MTKNEYLKKLENALTGLPYSEIKDVLSDYEEHFEAGKSAGRTDKELVDSLGDPIAIAKQIKATAKIKKAEKNVSVANIMRAILATAGLGFVNVVFILGPFLGLVGTLIGLFGAGIGITAGGIGATVGSFVLAVAPNITHQYLGELGNYPVAGIFFGIALSCFGLLFLVGCSYLTKWFYTLTVNYLKFNARIITGEKE